MTFDCIQKNVSHLSVSLCVTLWVSLTVYLCLTTNLKSRLKITDSVRRLIWRTKFNKTFNQWINCKKSLLKSRDSNRCLIWQIRKVTIFSASLSKPRALCVCCVAQCASFRANNAFAVNFSITSLLHYFITFGKTLFLFSLSQSNEIWFLFGSHVKSWWVTECSIWLRMSRSSLLLCNQRSSLRFDS